MYTEGLVASLKKYGIEIGSNEPDKVRDAIRAAQTDIHPDKTGGEFSDEDQKEKFLTLQQLLEQFNHETTVASQLVPLHQVSGMMETVLKAQAESLMSAMKPQKADIEQQSATEQLRKRLKHKYALPKISSAVIASLCFALISLLSNFKGHPLYKATVNSVHKPQINSFKMDTKSLIRDIESDWNILDLLQKSG
jgi:hypothetical protein